MLLIHNIILIAIIQITNNKKQFIDLLLLADEQESMMDRYLDDGAMFALYDNDLKSICVVSRLDDFTCELKNIAVYKQYQGQGYGRCLIKYISCFYKGLYKTLIVGTGKAPSTLSFYRSCGFEYSHVVENFFLDNYDHPIIEEDVLLVDMIYLRRSL